MGTSINGQVLANEQVLTSGAAAWFGAALAGARAWAGEAPTHAHWQELAHSLMSH